ncbi:hypothetical protein [Nocardioides sp. SR21]|uniref:hypothetical protein n=1 Tax=Nocardioides sp. SR21 TaxID=2919501 RepID=UPI001FAA25EB|nr:hypothetical protein [Nocardioides sp. SR21]
MTITSRTSAALAAGVAGVAVLVPLSSTPPAAAATSAGSIVFIKDHNVWIAGGDGADPRPLTTDGYDALPYRNPSQSDTGLVAASRYATIVTLDQQGNRVAEIDPPALPGSGGHPIDGAPVAVSVSPDGQLIAYSFAESCGPGCGFRTATGYVSSAGTDPAAKGTTYLVDPSWVTNTRTLQSGGYGSQVMIHDVGPAAPRHWFDDGDIWDPSTDYGNVEVSPDGTLLAGVRGTGDILTYRVNGDVRGGNPPLPADGCFLDDDTDRLSDPTWGPDSDTLAFSGAEGVFTFDDVRRNVCSEGTITLIIPGGSEPDWSAKQLSAPAMNSVTIPEITGKAVVGGTLRASNGTWTAPPTDYTYQWFREDSAIAGANDARYVVGREDAGKRIRVVVTADRPGWPTGSSNSHAVSIAEGTPDELRNTRKPAIQGKATVGRTVRATPGAWTPTPAKVSYQWLRDGATIQGATGATYRVTRSDRRHQLSVRVTAVRGDSRASAASRAVTVRR